LDSKTRTEIDEFSTSGFIGVRQDGETTTLVVPDSKSVIKSVTSDSTCQIARDLFGFNVEKRKILYEELKDFKEVMAAGTAASLVPIKSITKGSDKFEYPVTENGEPGPVCTKLLTTLKGIQQGRIKDTFGWNFEVTAASPKDFAGDAANGVNGDVRPHEVDELP
jgi:branched-chain amino acid aminotransferase